jgi:hypothetical protein
MRTEQLKLYKYDELSDEAKKKARCYWLKYFHDQYSLRLVGNNVRGFFQQYSTVLDLDLKLVDEKNQGMYMVSVNSVLFSGKFLYKGQEIRIDFDTEGGELVYKFSVPDNSPDSEGLKQDFSELLGRIREHAGRTYWWYFKWVSSGRIFEYYGFDLLEDGTPVKLSFAKEESGPFPASDAIK